MKKIFFLLPIVLLFSVFISCNTRKKAVWDCPMPSIPPSLSLYATFADTTSMKEEVVKLINYSDENFGSVKDSVEFKIKPYSHGERGFQFFTNKSGIKSIIIKIRDRNVILKVNQIKIEEGNSIVTCNDLEMSVPFERFISFQVNGKVITQTTLELGYL